MRLAFISRLRMSQPALAAIVLIGVLGVPVSAIDLESAIEQGGIVYHSEGCADCHEGSSRKGPDLSQVGARRSALWLKMHLYNPGEVSGSSTMPSYASLFRSQKGNDLVAYLASLRSAGNSPNQVDKPAWQLPKDVVAAANPSEGKWLYSRYCATCHDANGRTRLKWQSEFIEQPAILRAGSMQGGPVALEHLAQIIKFGIPDSDMAGHENMPDKDIAALVAWLTQKTSAGTLSSPN